MEELRHTVCQAKKMTDGTQCNALAIVENKCGVHHGKNTPTVENPTLWVPKEDEFRYCPIIINKDGKNSLCPRYRIAGKQYCTIHNPDNSKSVLPIIKKRKIIESDVENEVDPIESAIETINKEVRKLRKIIADLKEKQQQVHNILKDC